MQRYQPGQAVQCGGGFLLGALTPQGEIDVEAVQNFGKRPPASPLNFHLAWEQTKDPEQALEKLIELGIKSVRLTGGRRLGTKAPDGTERIRRFQNQADGRIDLFLAGGVTPPKTSPGWCRKRECPTPIQARGYVCRPKAAVMLSRQGLGCCGKTWTGP